MTWKLSKALPPRRPTTRPTLSARRKARPSLEFLERREVLSTFTWTGAAGDGLWDTGTNWQGGVAPTPASGPVALAFPLNSGTEQLITLGSGDAGLQIQAIDIQGGQYKLQGPTAGGKQVLALASGALLTLDGTKGARLTINPATSPDSLALDIMGLTTFSGIGSLILNTSTVTYSGNPSQLQNFTVDSSLLTLGAGANLTKTRIVLTGTSSSLVVPDGITPTVASVHGKGNVQIGTGSNPSGTGLVVSPPAGENGTVVGIVNGQGGTLTKSGAGSFSISRVNPGNNGPFTLNVQAGNLGLSGSSLVRQTTLASGSTFTAILNDSTSAAKITAPSGGTMNLGGSTLAIALASGYTPAVGDSFTLISAPSGITGQFGNAANGATITPSGSPVAFRVNYATTAVTLTAVTPSLITTTTTMTAMNPVAPGSTVTFSATVRNASNNPVPGKGYVSFWYTDEFQTWTQLGGWNAVGANGQATSAQRTLPLTYTAGAVVAFYVDNQAPVQYKNSWSQDSGSILFPIVQWYNTNTALSFNSSNNRLTATVTSPNGTPTWLGQAFSGTVLFKQNGVTIGGAQVVNGVAILQLTGTPKRGTQFTAEYNPTAAFSVLSSSGSLTV